MFRVVLVAILVGSWGLLSAQDPVTVVIDRIEVSTRPEDGFKATFTKSGGSFTANMTAPALGGGPTINGEYTLALTPNKFTSVAVVNAITLTPMPVFKVTMKGSSVSVRVVASGLNGNICYGQTATELTYDCPQRFVDYVVVSGRRQAKVVSDVSLGNASATLTAYYNFEPPPNHVEIVGDPSPSPYTSPLATGKVTFRARVKYATNLNAWVALRLYDTPSDGILQGSSEFFSANRTEGETELTIPDFEVKEEHRELYLRVVLINRATETVVIASSNVKYARPPDISIDRLELVQIVQSENPRVLMSGRRAILRVFVKQAGEEDDPFIGITARIRAIDADGREVLGNPILLNTSGGTARTKPDRFQEGHSLNYLLPESWVPPNARNQTDAFQYEVELLLPPGREEGPKDNNKKSLDALFRSVLADQFSFGVVRVCVDGVCPKPTTPEDWFDHVVSVLPFPANSFVVFGLGKIDWPPSPDDEYARAATTTDLNTPAGAQFLLSYLAAKYFGPFPVDVVMGRLPELPGAQSDVKGQTISIPSEQGEIARALYVKDDASNHILAHEMGHVFGLRHTNTPDSCGATAKKSDWPFPTSEIGDPGFDVERRKFIPAHTKDIMSYCSPPWLSAQHYSSLVHAMVNYDRARSEPIEPPAAALKRPAAESAPYYIAVSGFAAADGSAGGLTNAYEASPIAGVSRHVEGGTHCLRSFGDSGMLAQNCFNLNFEDANGNPLTRAYFSRRIALPAASTRLTLSRGDVELAALSGTALPTVEITSPAPGSQLGGRQTVSWSGSAPSGAPLTYSLHYSADGGATWPVLMPSSYATSFDLAVDALPNGNNLQLRVLASNGLRTAAAVVGNLKVSYTPKFDPPPAALDFGNVQMGQIAEASLVLKNSGEGLLQVKSIAVDRADFRVTRLASAVAAGRPEPLTVRFSPTDTGIQNAILTIETDDPVTPRYTVFLAGAGFNRPVPNVAVSPTQVDFGELALGQSKTAELTISNAGNGPLTVASLSFSAAVFSSASGRLTVGAGGQAKVTIQFRPTAAGRSTGTLTVNSDDPSRSAVTVALIGGGTAPASSPRIETSVTALDFGTVTVNQPKELSLAVRNTGTAPLVVSGVAISNLRFGVEVPGASFTIAVGATQNLPVRFLPTAAGAQTGNLTITSNDPTRSTLTITLSGTGTAATASAPALSYSPTALAFGNVAVGTTQTLTLTVTNTGTAQLTASLGVGAPFALAPSNLGLVEPGASVNVRVSFTPVAAGAASGSISGVSNDPNRPSFTIGITGTGGTGQTPTGASCPSTRNISVSPFGVASQSTTAYEGPASLGNNGVIDEPNGYGFHTAVENSPWWQVDLGAVSTVCEVRLYNRTDPAALRARTVRILLSTNGTSFDTVYIHDGSAFTVAPLIVTTQVANRQARYVRIQLNEPEYLHLREVQVFGGSASSGAGGGTTLLTPTSAAGWPNGRTSDHIPALAIDGSTSTYTWTTESFNSVQPSYLGVSLGAAATVSRIRIYKDNDPGVPSPTSKNLMIEYTTSSVSTPLASRVWAPVSGLANGFNGTEPMTATAVSGNTVTGDNHVSQTSGWASLTFAPVSATGIRIGFSNPQGSAVSVNHYRVYEVQVYGSTGTGSSPSISVTPSSLNLGSVTVGSSGTATLTVRNTGTATLTGTLSVAAPFSASPTSLSIAAGGETPVTVRFSPTTAGVASGTLTISSNDPALPSQTVSLTGTGTGAGAQSTTLQVDDGTYELNLGLPSGGTVYFVNRLTPPRYPATLKSIQIYFGSDTDELALGHPVTVLWGANAGGGANINGLSLTRFSSAVAARGQFNSLTLAAPVTITSGDFVVGFTTNNPANIYPMAVDQTPPLKQRSYVSVDGAAFTIVDSIGASSAGNFAIRAVVEVPAQ